MLNTEDLIRSVSEGDDVCEDTTEHKRTTPYGERTDFVIRERVSLSGTVREVISKQPLECAHHVTAQNPFAGYCQHKKRTFLLLKKVCGEEYCERCAVQCSRCQKFVSAHCCAREFEGKRYCKSCRRVLVLKKLVLFVFGAGEADVSDDPLR